MSGRRSSFGALLPAFTWEGDNAEDEDKTLNTSPNTTFSWSFSRSLDSIARLAPPVPRRSRKILVLSADRFAERPCGWLDQREWTGFRGGTNDS